MQETFLFCCLHYITMYSKKGIHYVNSRFFHANRS